MALIPQNLCAHLIRDTRDGSLHGQRKGRVTLPPAMAERHRTEHSAVATGSHMSCDSSVDLQVILEAVCSHMV